MKKSQNSTKRDLSIVIISYNTSVLTEKCLESIYTSLRTTALSYEIIVVDNASTDGSVEMIRKKYPHVRLFTNTQNKGFGKSNNDAVDQAQGEIILLLNSDTEVLDDAIEKLFYFQKKHGEKIICGGKLFNVDGSPQPSAGPAYSLLHIFIALFLKGDYMNITRYSPVYIKEVDWIMGACIMFYKTAFVQSGGFDTAIFMYMEEIDWLYRAKKLGYQVFFYPDACFTHVGHASSGSRTEPILNVFRGFIFYYKKHYSYLSQWVLQLILLSKSLLALIGFALLGKKNNVALYRQAFQIALKF